MLTRVKTGYLVPASNYLIADRTLIVLLTITNPFSNTISSNSLELELKYLSDSVFPCSPCQFYNRNKCLYYDSVCWENYLIYKSSYPLLYTEDCLVEIAKECYNVWKENSISDSQCLNFVNYMDFDKMSIKPTVSSSAYYINGILKIKIEFDTEIKTSTVLSCSAIFNEATLASLGSGAKCTWTSSQILEVEYTVVNSLVTSLTLRENAIYHNYIYSVTPADAVTITPTVPDLSGTLSISAASKVSVCDTLLLTAVTQVNGVFEYTYKWELSYPSASASSTILSNFESFASQNTKILIVTSSNLISEENLQVSLTAHISLLDTDIVATKSITIDSTIPVIQFASSETYHLNLIGNQTNDFGLVITADPCNTGTNEETEVTFIVHSGTYFSSIETRAATETQIESNLLSKYELYKTLQVNTNLGFEYNHYYNLMVLRENKRKRGANLCH